MFLSRSLSLALSHTYHVNPSKSGEITRKLYKPLLAQFCWAPEQEMKGLLRAAQGEGQITQKVPLVSCGPTVTWAGLSSLQTLGCGCLLSSASLWPSQGDGKTTGALSPSPVPSPIPRTSSCQIALLVKVSAGPFGTRPLIQPKFCRSDFGLEAIQVILWKMGFQENHSTGFL